MKAKLIIVSILLLTAMLVFAQESFEQPAVEGESIMFDYRGVEKINVKDVDNDDGTALQIDWVFADDVSEFKGGFILYRIDETGAFRKIGEFDASVNSDTDKGLERGKSYVYAIAAVDENGVESAVRTESSAVKPRVNAFKKDKLILFLMIVIYTAIIMILVETVKRGRELFVRKIAGLDTLDEAVGRATEMGRPVLYVPGSSTMSDVATIASLNILGPVAKKIAEYDTRLIVPNRDPIVMTVAKEVVKESYSEAGRPDAYNDTDVFFLTDSQFGYAAAISGIMVRERPATNLLLGMFWAESLIMAEAGNTTGAIQIAGTDAVTQLPFFITSCDYTIIGEELYAASAYLSREPLLMGTLKAQDYLKGFIIVAILLFFILYFIDGLAGGRIGFLGSFMDVIRFIFNS